MKEPIYRINVEVVGEEDECKVSPELRGGVPCNGFVIIADTDEGGTVEAHRVSLYDMAQAFSKEGTLLAAAHLGKAMKEAEEMRRKQDVTGWLDTILKRRDN